MFKVPGNVLQIPVSVYPTKQDAIDHILKKKRIGGGPHYLNPSYNLPGGTDAIEQLLVLPVKTTQKVKSSLATYQIGAQHHSPHNISPT